MLALGSAALYSAGMRISITITEELHDRLKRVAAAQDRSVAFVALRAIEKHVGIVSADES